MADTYFTAWCHECGEQMIAHMWFNEEDQCCIEVLHNAGAYVNKEFHCKEHAAKQKRSCAQAPVQGTTAASVERQ